MIAMNVCRGICATGVGADGTRFPVVHYASGRVPIDPTTGERPPHGSYGAWRRCRSCDIMVVWSGRYCPCCSRVLSARPPATSARRAAAFRRNNADRAADRPPRPCLVCGAEIPGTALPYKKYCGRKCADKNHAEGRKRLRKASPARAPRPCRECGAIIPQGAPTHQKFCSNKCAAASWYKRHRGAA